LVVTVAGTKEITEFVVFTAEAFRGVAGLEAPHTSDPALDAAMVLFKAIVQISRGPVPDGSSQHGTNRPRIGAMSVRCHPVRRESHGRLGRTEEGLRGGHVAGGAEHGVDEISVPIDRAVEIAPPASNLQVGFIDVPAPAGRTLAAMTPLPFGRVIRKITDGNDGGPVWR
jgi:hypothetical protein